MVSRPTNEFPFIGRPGGLPDGSGGAPEVSREGPKGVPWGSKRRMEQTRKLVMIPSLTLASVPYAFLGTAETSQAHRGVCPVAALFRRAPARMAPETSGGHARVAVKQKEGWLSRWYRARAAQRRRRRAAEPP